MSKRPGKKGKEGKARLPRFASEDAERRYWSAHDVTEHVDSGETARAAFPSLRRTTTAISLRIPIAMLEDLKTLANQRDVPYQSLMKLYLAECLKRERSR